MVPMNAMLRAYCLLLYFSRPRQIIQNILRFLKEHAQLDQNVLNDTHECYVLSAISFLYFSRSWQIIQV